MRGARFTRVASETNPSARRSTAPPVYAPRSAISANQSGSDQQRTTVPGTPLNAAATREKRGSTRLTCVTPPRRGSERPSLRRKMCAAESFSPRSPAARSPRRNSPHASRIARAAAR